MSKPRNAVLYLLLSLNFYYLGTLLNWLKKMKLVHETMGFHIFMNAERLSLWKRPYKSNFNRACKTGRKSLYGFRPKVGQNGARTRGMTRQTSSGARETRQPPHIKRARGGEFGFQSLLPSAAACLLSGEQFRPR
jgi:hypothetical protein